MTVPYGYYAIGATGNPKIACINKSTYPMGCNWFDMIQALQEQVDEHFAPAWGQRATLFTLDDLTTGYWALVFTDTADIANALGYHDVTPDGLPLGKVFVQTSAQSGEQPSVTASHELLEILGNPYVDKVVRRGRYQYAYENCDAVQRQDYQIRNVPVSNFVLPSWFGQPTGGQRLDFLGNIRSPFQIAPGGYMPVFDPSMGWTQIFGSEQARAAFNLSGHPRTERILSEREPIPSRSPGDTQ